MIAQQGNTADSLHSRLISSLRVIRDARAERALNIIGGA